MTAAATKKPIRVSADETVGPSVTVPVTQLDLVRSLLAANHVRFWVDHHAISIDEKPPVTVVNLARGTAPLAYKHSSTRSVDAGDAVPIPCPTITKAGS